MNLHHFVPVFVFILSFFAGLYLLNWLVPRYLSSILAIPNYRSSHKQSTPSSGGISFVFLSLLFAVIYFLIPYTSEPTQPFNQSLVLVILFASPLALVGFLDDRFELPTNLRLLFQLLTSAALIAFSPLFHALLPASQASSFLIFVTFLLIVFSFLVLMSTAVINFTNFMDGVDGLVGGSFCILIASLATYYSAPFPFWALIGSLSAFVLWNWSPAKVFMGDVGSTFLGAIFAAFILQSTSIGGACAIFLLATPLFADALFCVPRRFLAGVPILPPHSLHLYQRLHQAGWSHSKISTLYIIPTFLICLCFLLLGAVYVYFSSLIVVFAWLYIDQNFAYPFRTACTKYIK